MAISKHLAGLVRLLHIPFGMRLHPFYLKQCSKISDTDMNLLTNSDWAGIKRVIALIVVACLWSYSSYRTSFLLEPFRAAGLAFLTSGICLFLFWGGKNPCILWRHEFGDSLGVVLFEKAIVPIAPIWFVAFPTLFAHDTVRTFGFTDAIFVLLLFLVMVDFGGYQSALFSKMIEDRVELSFREIGLSYPPKSKLATFIVFGFLYVIVVGIILMY